MTVSLGIWQSLDRCEKLRSVEFTSGLCSTVLLRSRTSRELLAQGAGSECRKCGDKPAGAYQEAVPPPSSTKTYRTLHPECLTKSESSVKTGFPVDFRNESRAKCESLTPFFASKFFKR